MKFILFKNIYFLTRIAYLDKIIISLILLLHILNVSYLKDVEWGEYNSIELISQENEMLLNKMNLDRDGESLTLKRLILIIKDGKN